VRAPAWLRRHPIRWLLLVAAVAAASGYLGPKTSAALDAVHKLGGGRWGWLLVALAAEIASLLAFSVVTRWLITPASRPAFWRVIRLDLVTVALSHAVPAGSLAGTALGYQLLEEEGVAAVESGFVKVSQSLLSGVTLEVLLAGALFLQLGRHGPSTDALTLTGVGGVLLVLVVCFVALLAYRPTMVRSVGVRLLGWIPKVDAETVAALVDELSARMRELFRTPLRLGWVALWSLGNWVFDLISLWAALRAFGAPPSPVLLAVAFCVAQLVAALPISPAGLGVVESSLVPLLTGFGTQADVAVLGVLSWRVFNYWLPLPVGGLAYLGIVVGRRRATPPAKGSTRAVKRCSGTA
jgi:uncharacterized protein (TIRG00374 family)